MLKAQGSASQRTIGKFIKPLLNFESNNYTEKFDWIFEEIPELLLTTPLSLKYLLEKSSTTHAMVSYHRKTVHA